MEDGVSGGCAVGVGLASGGESENSDVGVELLEEVTAMENSLFLRLLKLSDVEPFYRCCEAHLPYIRGGGEWDTDS